MTDMRRKTVRDIRALKSKPEGFVCLTAATAPVAQVTDRHADLILVGDSLGMVIYGLPSTLGVTLEMMIAHGAAVVRSTSRALVVVDMPFGSYQENPEQAFRSAARIMADTGCGAVKLEGGSEMAQTISFLVQRGIPVVAHVGLQPQSVHQAGGYRVVGRQAEEGRKIENDARAVADAGAFGVVLECVTPDLAGRITADILPPTIGIGASAACDGQIIVTEDILGLTLGPHARFVRSYANLGEVMDSALESFARDVRARRYPSAAETYFPGSVIRTDAA